jgi:hypothetical protein
MSSKTNPETIRRLRVRQLFKARPELERTLNGVVIFYDWLRDHYPDLIKPGPGDDHFQRVQADVSDLIVEPKPVSRSTR